MKRTKMNMRRINSLVVMAWFVALVSPQESNARGANTGSEKSAAGITILDQEGRTVPDAPVSPAAQTFDVSVGPGAALVFTPSTLNIATGDTVRWTWASGGHSVTSGPPCTIDSQYCSPNDTNCGAGLLSGTGTVYQHTFAQPGTYSYFCAAHCSRGMTGTINVAPLCTPPPPNMVGWYPGEGNPNDGSTVFNNGMLVGGATFSAGMVGQSLSLNGVDAYVQAPANSAQDPTSAGSQDAWVRFNQLPSVAGHVMEIIGKGGGGTDFDLQAETDNKFRFYIAGGSNVASTTVIQTAVWYHVAGTWDATGLRLYVNGVLENTNPVQNLSRGQSGTPLQIGNQPVFGPRLFNGLIDEAELFDRALTAQEVANIFNAGSAGKCRPPLMMTAAVSRKSHGSAGTFDVNLPLVGTPGVECRLGAGTGDHTLVFSFSNSPASGLASVTSGTGSVAGSPVFSGNTMSVNLTGVTNRQTIAVTLSNVTDAFAQVLPNTAASASFLIGDTTGNGNVNAADVAQVKGQSGAPLTNMNFRTDINASGGVNASDISQVKGNTGQSLPP